MRRLLVFATILLATGAAGFAVAWARPELLGTLIRGLEGTAPPPPSMAQDPEAAITTLEEATADGWCARIGMDLSGACPASLPTVRLASPAIAAQIGMETARATSMTTAPLVSGNAEVTYATHETAEVRPRVSGRIARVHRDEGEVVRRGDVLLDVDSAEVGSAKALYLSAVPSAELARKDLERNRKLRASGAASEKELLRAEVDANRAEADLLNARQKLLNLGQTDADLAEIARTRDTSSLLKITSPQDGTLVERHAVRGEAVEPNTQLFIVADLAHLWCWIDVYEADVAKVHVGQAVHFTISGTEGPAFPGVVELVGFSVDPVTRTIRVRSELHNIDGRLLANQYGRAEITVGPDRQAVLVPRDAVQAERGTEFVFEPLADGRRFRTQRVRTRPASAPGMVEIEWGVKPGDTVVTTGSFLLRTEVFKSDLAESE